MPDLLTEDVCASDAGQSVSSRQQSCCCFATSSAAAAKRACADAASRSRPPPNAVAPAASGEVQRAEDPWTEVVHPESGQVYYWNQQTSTLPAKSHCVSGLNLFICKDGDHM